ncbi:transposase [Lentisphaera profundi]|uniref:Transposase n=1 Tax=Lentisphaera profundi TaxID=1658616 RepID=A0ABY7VU97_9BACT|nr:transposase [Lentisphaera profundi]WDE96401.1 transposase [Lentisphaera profundi]
MAHNRVKESCSDQSVYYLVTNRIAGGRMLFKDQEKQKLKSLLFAGCTRFSYQVIDYVFMDNHFHLLIKIPATNEMDKIELLQRYRLHKKNEEVKFINSTQREEFREKIHDISFIIGNFEQRFVQWFNKVHSSWGRLFGQRFDSEMIEVSAHSDSLLRVMAYISLNPVRAEIVSDPKDFHFCAYSDRLAGGDIGKSDHEFFDLFCRGIEAKDIRDKQKHFRQVFRAYMLGLRRYQSVDSQTLAEFFREVNLSEQLAWDDLFIHKCRFFTKCLVIGSEAFVRNKLTKFSAKMKWKRVHEPYTEDEWNDIYSLKPRRRQASAD